MSTDLSKISKSLPSILTPADWNKKKGAIAKMAGETGIGKILEDIGKNYSLIQWELIQPVLEEKALSVDGIETAKLHYINFIRDHFGDNLEKFIKLADGVIAKFKKNPLIPKSSREHVESMKTAAQDICDFIKKIKGPISEAGKHANKTEADWIAIVNQYSVTILPNDKDLKSFVTDKVFGKIPGTQNESPELQKLQAVARDQAIRYIRKLTNLKSLNIDSGSPKAIKAFYTAMMEANDEIGVDGLLGTLGQWRLSASQYLEGYNKSELKGSMDRLNTAVSAENERLGKLQQLFEKQILKNR